MAIIALQRKSELEYLKIMAIINAIIHTGNSIRAGIANQESPGGDQLKKSIETVRDMLLPHLAEDTDKRAQEVRERLTKEASQGPLKIKLVGGDNRKKGRVRLRRKS